MFIKKLLVSLLILSVYLSSCHSETRNTECPFKCKLFNLDMIDGNIKTSCTMDITGICDFAISLPLSIACEPLLIITSAFISSALSIIFFAIFFRDPPRIVKK